jgi:hypothetical protein
MYGALFPDEVDQALRIKAREPGPPPAAPGAFGNFWGALVRGPAAGVLDMVDVPARQIEREQNLRVRGLPSLRGRDERLPKIADEISMESPLAQSVREALTPDPLTTGVMSQIVFGAGNVLTQAGVMGLAGGPLVGAAGVGVVQGAIETGKLQDEGVDTATAAQAGIVKGATLAASFAAPVLGKTLLETIGIIAVTGPGAFMAEQAGIRAVLDAANYDTQAAKYDPFDPVGLTVSTLAPALFAGAAGAVRSARRVAPPDSVESARALKNQVETERQVLVRDQADPAVQAAHQKALADAAVAIDAGRPLDGLAPPADPAVVAQVEAEIRARLAADPELRAAVEAEATVPVRAAAEPAPAPDAVAPAAPAADPFPRVDSLPSFSIGPGAILPKVIAEGSVLYRETSIDGLEGILRYDGQFQAARLFVTDNIDLALGQGSNRGVQVEFRPNALSGEVHAKPGTGDLAGREYATDLVAPRAVQSITFDKMPKGKLRGLTIRVLRAEFVRQDLPDGRVRFVRKQPPAQAPQAADASAQKVDVPAAKAEPKADAPARRTEAAKPAPELPETLAARAALARMPDLQLEVGRDADGAPITRSAAELLDEADMEARQAEVDSQAFEAAVMCEIGSGA